MLWFLTSCLLLSLQEEKPSKVERRMITITAQKVPEPSFRYVLIPPLADRRSGNAVQDYFRCLAPDTTHFMRQNNYTARLQAWLEQPFGLASRKTPVVPPGTEVKKTAPIETTKDADGEDLPPKPLTFEEVSFYVKYSALDDLDRGARCGYADWGYHERIKATGMATLLPELNTFYLFKMIVQTRARLHLMTGNYDKALYGLQTGYSIAQHLNDTNLIVCTMNGVNFATGMNSVVEEFIQQPGSPNLYWALTQLPRPLIDLNKAYLGDRMGLQYMYGDLSDMEKRIYTQAEMDVVLQGRFKEVFRMYGPQQAGGWPLIVLKHYPEAKAWLKTKGWSASDIEKMTSSQAVFLYGSARYTIFADEFQQGMYLPYGERYAHAMKFDAKVKEMAMRQDIAFFMGIYFFNPYPGMWVTIYQLDRHMAVLRCVEALRHHAAAIGKLPTSWDDIKDLPIPVDPVTGQRFGYELKADHAEVSYPAIPGVTYRPTARVYDVYLK